MGRKKIYLVWGILVLLVMLVGSYAYFSWKTSESRLVLTVGNINNIQVTLKPYKIDTEILPVLSYENEDYVNVDAVNSSNSDKKFKLYYKINTIAEELKNSNFKYTITKSVDGGSTYSEIKTDTFSNVEENQNITIYDYTISGKTTEKYRVYIWLDGSEEGQTNVVGKAFNAELRAEFDSSNNIVVDVPDGLIPVVFDTTSGTSVKTISENDSTWYNYNNQEWANAVLVVNKAIDLSVNNTESTINGAIFNNGGLEFDGVDDSVLLPQYSASSLSNGFTLEAMISADSVTANDSSNEIYFIANLDVGGNGIGIFDGKFGMYVYNATTSKYVAAIAPNALETNKKYLLTGVFTGSSVKIYIDGELVATTNFSGTINDPVGNTHYFFGCNPKADYCQYSYFDGTMHEARMYKRALNDAEVKNNYNQNITGDNLLFNFDLKTNLREEYKNNVVQINNTVEDLSGNNTANTITGATFNDEGLVFDGVNDGVLLPEYSISSLSNGFTLETMISASSIDYDGEMYLIGNLEEGGNGIALYKGKFGMGVFDSGTYKYIGPETEDALEANRKYLLTGVFTGSSVKIYVDGVLVGTTAYSGTKRDPLGSTHYFLGCNPYGNRCVQSYFNGTMYEARMYNRALSDAEVSNNYNGNTTSSGLLFNFDFKNQGKYKENSGITIPEENILAYYTYVPRYSYKIWETGTSSQGKEQTIDIQFENASMKKSTGTTVGSYITHPGFTFGDLELNGIWVGKFDVSGTLNEPTILPDKSMFRSQSLSTFFKTALKFSGGSLLDNGNVSFSGNSTYGLTINANSHMTKNSEWGAVAYLSHSKYGVNREVYINNSSYMYTGRSGGNVGGSTPINGTYTDQTSTTQYSIYGYYTWDGYLLNYNTNTKSSVRDLTKVASTTGNITGIYDMVGGAWDYVMGYYNGASTTWGATSDSNYAGFSSKINGKYYDNYSTTNLLTACNGGLCYGHSLSETNNWYGDYTVFIDTSRPWFGRGGVYYDGSTAGMFFFYYGNGDVYNDYSFRSVIIYDSTAKTATSPKISFGTNGNTKYVNGDVSSTITVSNGSTELDSSTLKYIYSTSKTDTPNTSFTSGNTYTLEGATGTYYLIAKACNVYGLCTTEVSNPFYVDNEVPTLSLTKETYQEGFDGWTMPTGGSVSDGILTLSQSGSATSDYYAINGERWRVTYDAYTTGDLGTGAGGVHSGSSYYDVNKSSVKAQNDYAGNGNAHDLSLNTWKNDITWNCSTCYGTNTKYLKFAFSTGTTYSQPTTKVRNFKVWGQLYSNSFYNINISKSDNIGIKTTKYASGSQTESYFTSNGTVVTDNVIRVTDNNTYTVYVEDVAGNKKISTIAIDKIDKVAPTGTISISFSSGTLKGTVSASDSVSGIASYMYALTTNSTCPTSGYTESTNNSYSFTLSGTGTYYICTKIKDNVGNVSAAIRSSAYTLSDTTAPTCTISVSGTTVTATFSDNAGGSGIKGEATKTATINAVKDYTFTAEDNAGNSTSCGITVTSTDHDDGYDYVGAGRTPTGSCKCTKSSGSSNGTCNTSGSCTCPSGSAIQWSTCSVKRTCSSGWTLASNGITCYKWRGINYYCNSGTKINDSYCYTKK